MLHVLDRGLTAVCVVAAALVIVLLFAGPTLIGAKKSSPTGATSGSGSSAPSGSAVFASAKCGGCHTLKAAHASGTVGPNLDQLRPECGHRERNRSLRSRDDAVVLRQAHRS